MGKGSIIKYKDAIRSIIQIYLISSILYLFLINGDINIKFMINVLSVCGWCILVYIFLKTPLAEWKDMIFGDYGLGESGGRLGPTIGMHTNMCGSVLLIFIFIALYKWVTEKRIIDIIQISILLVCLMFTKSRTSLLIGISGISLFILLYKKITFKQFINILLIALLLGLLIYSSINNEFLYNLFGKRIESMFNLFDTSSKTDASVTGRLLLQQKAIEVFKKSPIIGVGMGNFSFYNNLTGSLKGFYTHNNYLEMLTGVGIIGTILYYFPFVHCLIELVKKFKAQTAENRILFSLFIVLLTVRLIADISQVSYLFDSTQIILICAYSCTYKKER